MVIHPAVYKLAHLTNGSYNQPPTDALLHGHWPRGSCLPTDDPFHRAYTNVHVNTCRLLDKETGELLQEYTGHKNTDFKIDSRLT